MRVYWRWGHGLVVCLLLDPMVLSFVHIHLQEHDRVGNISSRRFQGKVLGYVTPW